MLKNYKFKDQEIADLLNSLLVKKYKQQKLRKSLSIISNKNCYELV